MIDEVFDKGAIPFDLNKYCPVIIIFYESLQTQLDGMPVDKPAIPDALH